MSSAASAKSFALLAAFVVCSTLMWFHKQTFPDGTPRHPPNDTILRLKPTQTVVCMIHTTPDSWSTRAKAVRHTWGPRCTFSIYFYSNKAAGPDHEIRKAKEAVGLDVEHGRNHLNAKTRAGVEYSFEKYGEVADWYMKVDDDAYLIWENLISLLNELQQPKENRVGSMNDNDRKPLYVGRHFVTNLPHGYNSGGAGYLLNSPAARLYLDGAQKNPTECRKDGGVEDLETGRCLASFGVYPSNTYGKKGKLRFHCQNPMTVFDGSEKTFYIAMSGAEFGSLQHKLRDQMLSEEAVTFHYVTPAQILMFDFLLYHLKVGKTLPETTIEIENSTAVRTLRNGSRNG